MKRPAKQISAWDKWDWIVCMKDLESRLEDFQARKLETESLLSKRITPEVRVRVMSVVATYNELIAKSQSSIKAAQEASELTIGYDEALDHIEQMVMSKKIVALNNIQIAVLCEGRFEVERSVKALRTVSPRSSIVIYNPTDTRTPMAVRTSFTKEGIIVDDDDKFIHAVITPEIVSWTRTIKKERDVWTE